MLISLCIFTLRYFSPHCSTHHWSWKRTRRALGKERWTGYSVWIFFFKVTHRVWLSTEHCQSFIINATSKLVTKLRATHGWLIQHSNRISKLSGLSSQIEMLDWGFSMKLSWVLITGMWKCIGFDSSVCGFQFWMIFLRFCSF